MGRKSSTHPTATQRCVESATRSVPSPTGACPPKSTGFAKRKRMIERDDNSTKSHPAPAARDMRFRSRDAASHPRFAFTLQESPSNRPDKMKGAERRKARSLFAMPAGARRAPRRRMLPFVRASGALAFRRSTAALASWLAPTNSAPGHASWDAGRAGVTRPRLSQSRDCTSRAGRSTGVTDARSRPGAVCETARGNRTCSTF